MICTDPVTDIAHDVVVVGAGFGGLYALHRLRGLGFSVRVLDAADDIGGTWYWNAYPGARCDVESLEYSYSFSPELDQEWVWTERYATQPEILRYINHVAERFDLRRDIQLRTRVERATWGDDAWTLETDDGERIVTRFAVFATGSLSAPLKPTFPGVESFAGESYMTQDWPREPVDFAGKRVAVIGTGSSGVQAVPVIAQEAAHVTVFQRTPNFSLPAHNRPLSAAELAAFKATYPEHRAKQRESPGAVVLEINRRRASEMTEQERDVELQSRWDHGGALTFAVCFKDVATNLETNTLVADFIRAKIRDKVDDSALAELLCPSDHPFGTKRPCVDHGYFETFNRDDVELVSVRDNPIAEITPSGVKLEDGSQHDVDVIVYALGYDAISGALLRLDIRGRDGLSLREAWADGPQTFLGLAVAGFPNLFMVNGPGSPTVLAMMIAGAEQHVDWIADCIIHMRAEAIDTIEATVEAAQAWTEQVEAIAAQTVHAHATSSYYRGANVPGKPQRFPIFLGGLHRYRKICDAVSEGGYSGFALTQARAVAEVTPG